MQGDQRLRGLTRLRVGQRGTAPTRAARMFKLMMIDA